MSEYTHRLEFFENGAWKLWQLLDAEAAERKSRTLVKARPDKWRVVPDE